MLQRTGVEYFLRETKQDKINSVQMEGVYPLNKDLIKIYSELVDAELSSPSDNCGKNQSHRAFVKFRKKKLCT